MRGMGHGVDAQLCGSDKVNRCAYRTTTGFEDRPTRPSASTTAGTSSYQPWWIIEPQDCDGIICCGCR